MAGIVELPDIDHLDRPKRRDMRDESVDPRADIDMPGRCRRVNQGGDEQILMKIVAAGGTGLVVIIGQDWENMGDDTAGAGESSPILLISPKIPQMLQFAGVKARAQNGNAEIALQGSALERHYRGAPLPYMAGSLPCSGV